MSLISESNLESLYSENTLPEQLQFFPVNKKFPTFRESQK